MVEVFKTNVTDRGSALRILDALHESHLLYVANFDLDDCDRVLRVKCLIHDVDALQVISLVATHGFRAEVMGDLFVYP